MRLAAFLSLAVAASATVVPRNTTINDDPFQHWAGPKGGDVRGPCPFLNTFANHGLLPRSGKYITYNDLFHGLSQGANFDAGISQFLFNFAVGTNPQPNSTWFSLDHLTRHNVLEHDASLSRVDAYLGHADIFNQEAFDETLSHYGDIVDVHGGAAAIVARMNTCNATNPTYSLSELGESFIMGETAAFISVLGDAQSLTADKRRVEYLFQNERLPTELGWTRPTTQFTLETLGRTLTQVRDECDKLRNSTVAEKKKRRGTFAGSLIRGSAKLVY